VLDGIEAAHAAGLGPIKVNMVVKRGTNDHEILPMARHFKGSGTRCASSNTWTWAPPTAGAWTRCCPRPRWCAACTPNCRWWRWTQRARAKPPSAGATRRDGRHDPALGEVGVISSVTQAFCGDCNRARLSTEGKLYLCLFATQGHDLRALLRGGASDADRLAPWPIWQGRSDRYSRAARCSLPADIGGCRAARSPQGRDELHRRRDKGLQLYNGLPGFAGPLAGILTALHHCTTPFLLAVPCDSPLLPRDLVTRLSQPLAAPDCNMAIAVTPDVDVAGAVTLRAHPVFCLMRTSVRPGLEDFIARGERRIGAWAAAQQACRVPFDDAQAFLNINTLSELHALSQ
jgi:molybdopterin-guanine dinucleotide biosynthesis protein A